MAITLTDECDFGVRAKACMAGEVGAYSYTSCRPAIPWPIYLGSKLLYSDQAKHPIVSIASTTPPGVCLPCAGIPATVVLPKDIHELEGAQ